MYIHEKDNWTDFAIDFERISTLLASVRNHQGRLIATFAHFGMASGANASLETLMLDVLKSSEIEGERFNPEHVRSSLARKLGIELDSAPASVPGNVDGAVDMTLDAVANSSQPLTKERLFAWHAALFPTGYSGLYKITAGAFRTGDVQVVSGGMGMERVHYRAPAPERVGAEIDAFLEWFNRDDGMDLFVKAAVAHVWLVMIHPFDDGNGRITRAVSDMLVARSDASPLRLYSLSNQILKDRKSYYALLERIGTSDGDLTEWVEWFLRSLDRAMAASDAAAETVLAKARFWDRHAGDSINPRQARMINSLFDGFEGNLTSGKWAKINKVSSDTALADIKELVALGILRRNENAAGRSTNYSLTPCILNQKEPQ